jgi:hypothetical protein
LLFFLLARRQPILDDDYLEDNHRILDVGFGISGTQALLVAFYMPDSMAG